MNKIELSPNWYFIGLFLLISLVAMVAAVLLETKLFKLIALIVMVLSVLEVVLLTLNKKMLHFYRAGMLYSNGIINKYINSEDIKHVAFKHFLCVTVVVVTLENGKTVRFFQWNISAQSESKLKSLY